MTPTNGAQAVAEATSLETPSDAMAARLRAEAAMDPDPVATGPVTKETQIIAIYGKGGIGKSTISA